MRYCKLLLIFLFVCPGIKAQEIYAPPPSSFITSFPFRQYSGGVMVIRAKFENVKDSLNFILDTGSGGVSLDSSTCDEFKIATRETDTTITGIGGIRKVHFVFNKTLSIPGLTLTGLNFHINNYEVLSSVYGEKIDGILGYSFFSRYVVHFNFDKQVVDVYTSGKYSYPEGGTLLKPVFTSLPIQPVTIRDRRKLNYNFYFDTGAGLCFLLNEKFVKDSSILLAKRKPFITQAEGMTGRLQMRLTVMREVKLGPYRFKQVPTYLYQDDFNVTSYPFAGGLIGNELLRRFNFVLNYGQREIHLVPNSHFNEPFDYSYTGLGIYYVDGKIIVEDVIENSPASRSGFLVGDEIFAVDNNITHNIQTYKNILQTPNVRIRVIVKRNNEMKLLLLKTESIL